MPDEEDTEQGSPQLACLTAIQLRNAMVVHSTVHSGSEALCAFCRTKLDCLESGMQVEAELDGVRRTLHFHSLCHYWWKAMREGDAKQSV
jgi:hypothetical protein